MTRTISLILLACAALISQDTPPGEDPEPRPGQPLRCDNYHTTKVANRCACSRAKECPREGEGKSHPSYDCKTNCRPSKCGCLHPCTTKDHGHMPVRMAAE